jgi:hypothetical protein
MQIIINFTPDVFRDLISVPARCRMDPEADRIVTLSQLGYGIKGQEMCRIGQRLRSSRVLASIVDLNPMTLLEGCAMIMDISALSGGCKWDIGPIFSRYSTQEWRRSHRGR